jgi:hypothetical protein
VKAQVTVHLRLRRFGSCWDSHLCTVGLLQPGPSCRNADRPSPLTSHEIVFVNLGRRRSVRAEIGMPIEVIDERQEHLLRVKDVPFHPSVEISRPLLIGDE